jgi:glyoxylase-like metal-dependent hydrolase (beta-lactamase superfamily II)
MKRPLKIILWSFGVVVSLVLVAAFLFYLKFRSITKEMVPAETVAINDTVWCIMDGFVNAYLFKGKSSYLLVDAGIDKKKFKAQLDKVGIAPEQVTTLLLTHSDTDHTGAIPIFTNATVYMHQKEEQMINGTKSKIKFLKSSWAYGPYQLLNDSDSLVFDGLKVNIILTPGHTEGSSCYIVGDDYLLTGDNLVYKDGKYGSFVDFFNMDTQRQIESIKSLPAAANFKYLLTAHHGYLPVRQ